METARRPGWVEKDCNKYGPNRGKSNIAAWVQIIVKSWHCPINLPNHVVLGLGWSEKFNVPQKNLTSLVLVGARVKPCQFYCGKTSLPP
jgi:hypothetical protein